MKETTVRIREAVGKQLYYCGYNEITPRIYPRIRNEIGNDGGIWMDVESAIAATI